MITRGLFTLLLAFATFILTTTPLFSQTSLIDEVSNIQGGASPRAAFGLRKLGYTYNGPLIRVRQDIHAAIADIFADSTGNIGVNSMVNITSTGTSGYSVSQTMPLSTFMGGANLFVTKWYDQSGNNFHVAQPNPSNQPKLLLSGGINNRGTLNFTSSSQQFLFMSGGVIPPQSIPKYTLNAVWKSTNNNAIAVIVEQNQTSLIHSRRACMLMYLGAYGFNGEHNDAHRLVNVASNENIITSVVMDNTTPNNITVYKNASPPILGYTNGYYQILNIGTEIFIIGKKGSVNSEFWDGNIAEILVFDQAMDASVQTSILRNQGSYFNVPTTSPGPPISLFPTVNGTSPTYSISLNWLEPIYDGGSPIIDYVIQFKESTDNNWTTFNDGVSLNSACTLIGLSPDSTYDFKVSAINALDTGLPAYTSVATLLPLKWLGFEGYLDDSDIKLKWTTAQEYNCSHFAVERSFATKESFNTIGMVKASGSQLAQEYTFNDEQIANGYATDIFYRIKQVDEDGAHTYSKTIRLTTLDMKLDDILIAPNPASNSEVIRIDIPKEFGERHEVIIKEMTGNKVAAFSIAGNVAFQQLSGFHLQSGIYYLQITSNGICHYQKLIVK